MNGGLGLRVSGGNESFDWRAEDLGGLKVDGCHDGVGFMV